MRFSLVIALLLCVTAVAGVSERCCLELRDGELSESCHEEFQPERLCEPLLEREAPDSQTQFLGRLIAYLLVGVLVFWLVERYISFRREAKL